MHRLTARLLLLFAIAGTLAPVALAVTAAPPRGCCLRMAARQCHGSGPESDQRVLHDTSCCNHECGRAATTSQWAIPQPRIASAAAQKIEARIAEPHSSLPLPELFAAQSTRAPPHVSIA